ncbi:MAG TPA: N-acetylmuramoyl-L-alanine amidase [Herpetosiphonaceae bacterium]
MSESSESSSSLNRRTFLKASVGVGTSVVIAGTELRFPASADAAPPTPNEPGPPAPFNINAVTPPTIANCNTWGARQPSSPIEVLSTKPTKVIVHHTATPNSTDYSLAHAYSLSRSIQNYHMDSNGWIDTGQQFTISRGGYITEGRHRSLEALQSGTKHVRGAHCSNQNDVAVGIENEGTYTTVSPPQALYNKLVALIAYICQQYGIPSTQIYGHRDFNATQCPGDKLYAMLPQIRTDVAAAIGGPAPRTWPIVQRGQSGERVKTVQYLLREYGINVTVDGIFGPATESAVKTFQTSKGVTADGIVGAATWEVLAFVTKRNDSGDAVRAIQSQLITKGYSLTIDGFFGASTETAVRNFQTSRSILSDGIVGLDTWNQLVK